MKNTELRTRIAAVLMNEPGVLMGEAAATQLADAVIRELNLAKPCESGCMWQIPNRVEDMTPKQRELLKRTDDE